MAEKKKKRKLWKIIAAIVVVLIIYSVLSSTNEEDEPQSVSDETTEQASVEETSAVAAENEEENFKKSCEYLDYQKFFRYGDSSIGQPVYTRGILSQSLGDDNYVMIDEAGNSILFLDDRADKSIRYMVDDDITLYGTYQGVENADMLDGTTQDVIVLYANYIELSDAVSAGGNTISADGASAMETSAVTSEYIFPDSNSRLLTDAEVSGLSSEQLRLAINEIYARHGRKFSDTGLQEYFNSKSWYHGTVEPDQFSDSVLNETEKTNAAKLSAQRDGSSSASNPSNIYGTYECHSDVLDAELEIGVNTDDGSDYVHLVGSSVDGSAAGEFYGRSISVSGGNYTFANEEGDVINCSFDGAGNASVSDENYEASWAGMRFPTFTGSYVQTESIDFSNAG